MCNLESLEDLWEYKQYDITLLKKLDNPELVICHKMLLGDLFCADKEQAACLQVFWIKCLCSNIRLTHNVTQCLQK